MRRILISSIGSGTFKDRRFLENYDQTIYRWKEKQYESRYVVEAMKSFFDIDNVILLGTAGSDWASLYYYIFLTDSCLLRAPGAECDNRFADAIDAIPLDPSVPVDPAVYTGEETAGRAGRLYYKHELDTDTVGHFLAPLKAAITGCLDIIVLKYGTNREEQISNLGMLQRIDDLLEDGDELYVDVTHAFRSLQFLELLAFAFFRKVSSKKVAIRMVSYALFEPNGEYGGHSPIVDLTELINLLDLFNAADEYSQFGTTHRLTKLDDDLLSEEEQHLLDQFSEAVSVNNIGGLQQAIRTCHSYTEADEGWNDHPIHTLTEKLYDEINSEFYRDITDEVKTQLNLARWHFDRKRYLVALVTAEEALITKALQLAGSRDPYDRIEREKGSKLLAEQISGDEFMSEMRDSFRDLRDNRNTLAHPRQASFNVQKRIEDCKRSLKNVTRCYVRITNNHKEMETLASFLRRAYKSL
jgi:CRISPR-associated DxTHG motif protein